MMWLIKCKLAPQQESVLKLASSPVLLKIYLRVSLLWPNVFSLTQAVLPPRQYFATEDVSPAQISVRRVPQSHL
jgi:hypothetical protein